MIETKLPVTITNNYEIRKGLSHKGQNEKSRRQRFMSVGEVGLLLKTVETEKRPLWRRDYAALMLGFYLGLRVSEAAAIERAWFRHINSEEVYVRRSKSVPRISFTCSKCNRKARVSATKINTEHQCGRCGAKQRVVCTKEIDMRPPEKLAPVVERWVLDHVKNYMSTYMRGNQRWFFEGNYNDHTPLEDIPPICVSQLERIFSSYCKNAGLDSLYSWHALRHGRGVMIWERFHDLVMVRDMLGQKSLSSAEIYIQMSPSTRQQALDKLNQDYFDQKEQKAKGV